MVAASPVPQLVPSRVCFVCDVCCRFPEADSFLRPYFTEEEIQRAVATGVDPAHFPEPAGGQIQVVPNAAGTGYLCPAFDPATSQCRIHEVRPLDCRLYPLAVMWNEDRSRVVLGWDTKCPFLREASRFEVRGSPSPARPQIGGGKGWGRVAPEIVAYAKQIVGLIEKDDYLDVYEKNPRLVGRFQDDVVILHDLPKLTARLAGRRSSPLTPRPWTVDDRPRFEQALARWETPLAAYAFAPHFIWRELFVYSWTELDGHLCLFAENQDGLFMPLPPQPCSGGHEARGEGQGATADNVVSSLSPRASSLVPDAAVLAAAFAFMRAHNHGSAVTRIENIPQELAPMIESLGYRLAPKYPDYLYQSAALAALTGDRYKSQRAACNRFEQACRYRYEPYKDDHREACLSLYGRWVSQQETHGPAARDAVARHMLRDAESAHRVALTAWQELGLIGRVVWVEDEVRAYTVGFPRSRSVFCVLLEIADREIPGLAQFIFRQFCREAVDGGYESVNTMDDSGLPSLARSKRAYHPIRLVPSYVATEPR
jgi:hypothetical protein